MERRPLRLVVTLLIGLLALPCWALTGPETAQQLNQRLAATPAQCIGGKPPYACSGVLLLPMAEDHPQPFWHHSAAAEARGAELFHFVRQDHDTAPLPGKAGYILHDRFTAIGMDKAYEVVDDGTAQPDSVLVRNWDEDTPEQLAVQALYYDISEPQSLLLVLRGQRDYFAATGQWLPLLRLASATGREIFEFDQQEQLNEGHRVADRLNARFASTAPCSDGSSGYFCSGVFVRTVDMGDYSYRVWNPSPSSVRIDGVSFTYLRKDILNVKWLVYSKGYVIRELTAPAALPMELACVYPEDAATRLADDLGACTFKQVCEQMGVTTLESWQEHFESPEQSRKSCSLGTSPAAFDLMRAIRADVARLDQWNEVVMRPWPQDAGERLPIEAFIHSDISIYEHSGLADAQYIQRDFLKHTGRYLPLLKLDLNAANGQLFTYDPAEQGAQ